MKNVKLDKVIAGQGSSLWKDRFAEINQRLDDGAEAVLLECGVDGYGDNPYKLQNLFRSSVLRHAGTSGLTSHTVENGIVVYRR